MNAGELVTCAGTQGDAWSSLGIIEDGAMIAVDGRVAWVGTTKAYRGKAHSKSTKTIDARGGLVTPGLVDPHTHLVFAGSREDELERKAKGETYASILASGGGIVRTIRETKEAPVSRIVGESLGRVRELVANGVTTIEVKTGYGGDAEGELKLLRSIELLRKVARAELVQTFLGLHAVPPGYRSGEEYLRYVLRNTLPLVAGLGRRPSFSDCFCEEGIFTREQCGKYLRASEEAGMAGKIHADEFGDSRGASLAAEAGCVSADHLGHSNPEGLELMGKKGVTAILLPMTSLYSGIRYADARAVMRAGCRVALGTDLSPNSWVESPQIVMGAACTGLRLTPAEALMGFTVNAARALGRTDIGRLEVGCAADFVVYSVPSHRFLPYRVGGRCVEGVYKAGRRIDGS